MVNIIKLITGEEIIGDVKVTNDVVVISKPCVLQMVPSRQNPDQPMMGLFPYGVYTENHEITVKQSNVIWMEKPVKELYNQYNSAFGSGIQLATL